MIDDVANAMHEWIWRGVREEGRIPRCSRTAGVELKMKPDDPRMMIWVFRAAIERVIPSFVGRREDEEVR